MEGLPCGQLVCEMKNESSQESRPFLSDEEVREIVAPLDRPSAIVDWFRQQGFAVKVRPNGMPLIARIHFERVMDGLITAGPWRGYQAENPWLGSETIDPMSFARKRKTGKRVSVRIPHGAPRSRQKEPVSGTWITKKHIRIDALVDALARVVSLDDGQRQAAFALFTDMVTKQPWEACDEHPIVQEFWAVFDYLDGDGSAPRLNHARAANLIAVNLNHFAAVATDRRQQIPPLTELKRHLRTSVRRKFVDIRTVRSALRANDPYNRALPEVLRCWVFERG
jgi:hypothetical protein